MRRTRRLSPEGLVLLAIVVFVLLAVIYPAVYILSRHKEPGSPAVEPSDLDIEIIRQGIDINVWLDGTITQMPLEEYLVGVVAAEMPASYEPEALKAQAVAARTYTLYKKNHGGCAAHKGADICTASAHCQAYVTLQEMAENWGANKQDYLSKITAAVNATASEVIYYNDETIQVFYHASSGGRTENCENVYTQALPYLKSVESEGEEGSSRYYGELIISVDDFKSRMQKHSPGLSFDGGVPLIGSIKRFESGRVESIEVGSHAFTGREIRGVFSLNSANFTIEQTDRQITFHTVGFGHGVGMSQTGANAMAKKGADYLQILTHYFSGVTVR